MDSSPPPRSATLSAVHAHGLTRWQSAVPLRVTSCNGTADCQRVKLWGGGGVGYGGGEGEGGEGHELSVA